MIRIGVCILCFLSFGVFRAQELTISGVLNGFDEGAAIALRDLETMQTIGRTSLSNAEFRLIATEKIDFPRSVHLSIGSGTDKSANLFLFVADGEQIAIQAPLDNFDEQIQVENSKYYGIQQEYNNLTKDLYIKRAALMQEYMEQYFGKPVDASIEESYWGKEGSIGKLDAEAIALSNAFLIEHAAHYFSLANIVQGIRRIEKPVLKEVYETLGADLQASRYGVFLKTYIDSPQMEEGMSYVDFEFENIKGEKQRLSDYFDGRYLLVDFSTLYCGASQMSRPSLENLSHANLEKLNVLTYYIDPDVDGFQNYIVDGVSNWNIVRNEEGRLDQALSQYVVMGTPTYFLFNPEGVLIKKWSGYGEGTVEFIEGLME